ncbi:MAG: Bacterial regulatory protein, arsR family [Methanocella sp. PtaU1.Bin125]|nr:MAG: Bacterial regulatory protein, arsR family [Methanocella sp. PtaU1.Bin125]
MKDILVVDRFDDMRLIMSEKHNRILRLVMEKEMSISDIARSLDMNPGSVHYYLKDLEKHGLARQVREEIKGGVVKKFYRSAARRIVLEPPDFSARDAARSTLMPDHMERLIRAIEYLGYHLPPENREDAVDLLARYDARMKGLMIGLQDSGLGDMESDGLILYSAFNIVLGVKAKGDPELNRLNGEFEKLFLRCE